MNRCGHCKMWIVLLLVVLCVPLLCALGVASYFRLSSDTKALRRSVMNSVAGEWDTKVALNIGSLTTGLVRGLSQLIQLPPEPRAAIDAIHNVEVGVYELHDAALPADYPAVLLSGDKTMAARGWERIVGVIEGNQCVAVYVPRKGVSARRLTCCVLVLHERDLVIVSARGNIKPLLDVASKHLAETSPLRRVNLASRQFSLSE
jgi:hypothetical protein